MFFRYFVACNPNLVCFVVLWHIHADVCSLSFVTQPLVHGSGRSHAKSQLQRVHIIRRGRLLGLDALHLVSTSTRIPLVSPYPAASAANASRLPSILVIENP